MKRFGNAAHKVKVILSVFNDGERLKGREIVKRVQRKGYSVDDAHLKMFIYYNMLYKHLRKEEINGVNHYSVI
jgi:hypothetical protein